MKTITVYLRKSGKIGSRIICLATGEAYSHIGVRLGDSNVFHSDGHGCHLSTFKDFSAGSTVLSKRFIIDADDLDAARARAIEKLGTAYDFLGVVGFGICLILKRLGIRFKIPLMNPRWMMCSEYVEYILLNKNETRTPAEVLGEINENSLSLK